MEIGNSAATYSIFGLPYIYIQSEKYTFIHEYIFGITIN